MIFYFSGTGNTRWAATQLAEATGEQLLFIPQELSGACDYQLAEGERVGFCFPVHGWQPPRVVRQFVERLRVRPASSRPYCFVLCTCGDEVGKAMSIFAKDLQRTGLTPDSVASLVMPETYVCLPFMHTDTPTREKAKIAAARSQLEEFKHVVTRRQAGYERLVKGPAPRLYSYVMGAYFNRHMVNDKRFTVAGEACLHCGRCARVCPVGNITFDEQPSWNHDGSCTCCLSCYHHCPVHAINYGRITRKRGQYYFKEEGEGGKGEKVKR